MPSSTPGYAVFFFPNAIEALGEPITPYLQDTPMGQLVFCREVDTGGAFIEMTLVGLAEDGSRSVHALMVPSNMVRMIVSTQSDVRFGFGPRLPAAYEEGPLPSPFPIARIPAEPLASPAAPTAEGAAPAPPAAADDASV